MCKVCRLQQAGKWRTKRGRKKGGSSIRGRVAKEWGVKKAAGAAFDCTRSGTTGKQGKDDVFKQHVVWYPDSDECNYRIYRTCTNTYQSYGAGTGLPCQN